MFELLFLNKNFEKEILFIWSKVLYVTRVRDFCNLLQKF